MSQKSVTNYSTKLSRCITGYIESSGYTVYKIAQITGLGRSAIHQVMSGRLIPTRDFFERLSAVFMITPKQKEQLTELYFKARIGEREYSEQLRIKNIIEKLPQYYLSSCNTSIKYNDIDHDDDNYVSGMLNVNQAVLHIIDKELKCDKPFISTTIPFENRMLYDLILQLIIGTGKNAVFEHFIRMFKSDNSFVDNKVELLENMLRMAMNTGVNYKPYCYYVHKDAADDIMPVYPYCLVTSEYVIMLTADFQSAILSESKGVIKNAADNMRRLRSCSNKIIEHVDHRRMFDIFTESTRMFSKSLEYQPCVTKFFTQDIVINNLIDIPEKPYIIETLNSSFFTAEKLEETAAQVSMNYFTKNGLKFFAETGIMLNMPGHMLKPLSAEERLFILTNLKNDIGSHFKMVDDDKITVPEFIQVISLSNQRCIIACLMEDKKFCFILSERSLCTAIDSFIGNLDETDHTMTDADAAEEIERQIELLRQHLTD